MEETYINPDAVKDGSLSINKIDNVALDLADKVNALDDNGKNTFLNKIGLGKIGVISQKQNWTSDYSSYTISDVVKGIIPQSFIDLAISIGAFFNDTEETINRTTLWGEVVPNPPGYFFFVGLGDISYQEMVDIYSCNAEGNQCNTAYSLNKVRVVKPIRAVYYPLSLERYCCDANNIEVIMVKWQGTKLDSPSLISAFNNCYKVKTIYASSYTNRPAEINSKTDYPHQYSDAFKNCYNLTNILLGTINANISFAQSSRLSNESILYMINKEKATSAITITLHPDAYARAMADADIIAALGQHKNIELASA